MRLMDCLSLGLAGASGKLGRRILALALEDQDFSVACGLGGVSCLNEDLGALAGKEKIGLFLTANMDELFEKSSLVIDVSAAVNLPNLLDGACKKKKPVVIGTTGHSEDNFKLMKEAAQSIPLFYTPNFSLVVSAMTNATTLLSRMLSDLCTIKIIETHHVHKKDQPSGTAQQLSRCVEEASSQSPSIESQRMGEVIGDHTIIFSCDDEELTLTHRSLSRNVFAKGALLTAKFLARQPPGLYSMAELLRRQ